MIELLAYWLNILKTWQIYLVFLTTQVKLCLTPDLDLFAQSYSYNLDLVYVDGDKNLVNSFQVELLISKR